MFSRQFLASNGFKAVRLHIIAAAVASVGLVACGDSKKTTTTPTTVEPGITNPTGNTNEIVANPTASASAINSDATGVEPTNQGTSSVVYTPGSGTAVAMKYALLTNNPNATDSNKIFGLSFYDYDPCIFTFNHGYSAFPSSTFSFGAFYLINGSNGTAMTSGSYSATATTGQHIAAAKQGQSGAGYEVNACKAKSYSYITGGTVSITAWDAAGTNPTTGTMNLEVTDTAGVKGTFAGDFSILRCKIGSSTTQPTPASPDPLACSSIK